MTVVRTSLNRSAGVTIHASPFAAMMVAKAMPLYAEGNVRV